MNINYDNDLENIIRPEDKFEFHTFLSLSSDEEENIYLSSSIDLLSEDKGKNDDTIDNQNIELELERMIENLTDLDIEEEEREKSILYISKCNIDKLVEVITNLISKYKDTESEIQYKIVRSICLSKYTPFIVKIECIKILGDTDLLFEIIQNIESQTNIEINYTILWEALLFLEKNGYDIGENVSSIIKNEKLNIEFRYNLIRFFDFSVLRNQKWLELFINSCLNNETNFSFLVYGLQLYKRNNILNIDFCLDIYQTYFTNNFSTNLKDNIKADFADFLLSLNNTECKEIAISILKSLSGDFSSLYHNKQNIHIVDINLKQFIKLLIDVKCKENEENTIKHLLSYLTEDNNELNLSNEKKNNIKLSIRRIQLDNGLYESYSLSGILYRLYWYINNHKNKESLLSILFEELSDEPESCSSGHLIRLMNVLTGTISENIIVIDPLIELKDSFNHKLRSSIEKSEHMDTIMDALFEQNETIVIKYLYPFVSVIRDELIKEYENIISIEIIEEEIRKYLTNFTIKEK